ncbi:hypothetical protein JNL27_04450 [bacterium]|nr:hypothetical protein [bacterium]
MKTYLAGLILLSLLTISAEAQSIGLPSNEPKPLKDFRLPDWGYTSTKLTLDVTALGQNRKSDGRSDYTSNQTFTLTPFYSYFRESEQRKVTFDAYMNSRFLFSKSRYDNSDGDYRWTTKLNSNRWQLHLKNENRSFFSGNYYRITPEFNYNDDRDEYKNTYEDYSTFPYRDKNKSTYDSRYYDAKLSLAFGIGRIRNVTPVVRALRLNERLKAFDKDLELDQSELEQAAVEFTRFPGYQNTYDRPDRFFWKSFPEKLSTLTPFETHYLNDVFDEVVGLRLQGSEIDLGARITRIDVLHKVKSEYDNATSKLKATFAGPELSARLYNNYSLKGQIGFTGQGNWDFRMNEKDYNPIKNAVQFLIGAEHLYVISDHVLWKINPSYLKVKVKSDNPFGDDTYTSSLMMLKSSLTYYIENRFNLEGSVNWSYLKNKPSSDLEGYLPADASYYLNQVNSILDLVGQKSLKQWQFRITINYFLTREMF